MSVLDQIKKKQREKAEKENINESDLPKKTVDKPKEVKNEEPKKEVKSSLASLKNKKTLKSNHNFISDIKVGDRDSGVYFVESSVVKLTKQNTEYTQMTLRDASGSIGAKIWSSEDFHAGDWIECTYSAEEYMNVKGLTLTKFMICEKEPQDMSSYLRVSDTIEYDIDLVEKSIDSIKNENCKKLVSSVLEDGSNVQKFSKVPYSVGSHYGVVGGLAKKTVSILSKVLNHDFDNDLEKDVAIASSILTYIGAVDCYTVEGCSPKETDYGKLVSVGVGSAFKVQSMINILGLTEDPVMSRILHVVSVVHSKSYEFKPMTPSAILINGLNILDNELTTALEFVEQDTNEGNFTAYDSENRRSYFKG